MTSVSLFARATVLPASSAAQVPVRPALPTIAATTTSTSGKLHNPLDRFGGRPATPSPRQARTNRMLGGGVLDRWRRRSGAGIQTLARKAAPATDGPTGRRFAVVPRECRDHFQRASADAAGRAEQGDSAGDCGHESAIGPQSGQLVARNACQSNHSRQECNGRAKPRLRVVGEGGTASRIPSTASKSRCRLDFRRARTL